LIVHPDAVETLEVPLERFQAIPGRSVQLSKNPCGIDQIELSDRSPQDVSREPANEGRWLPVEDGFGDLVSERSDHVPVSSAASISPSGMHGNR
jgi:hypothetical protein